MTRADWRKPCLTGCTCGKHAPRKYVCKDGCTCARHMERKPCPDGCTCGRHRAQNCEPNCRCGRHRAQATPEQKAAMRERKNAAGRAYMRERSKDPEYRAARLAYQRANPEAQRGYYLKSKFGISLARWEEIFSEQCGACYMCGDALDRRHIHVDHSHACCPGDRSCGSCVRGLACRWCNQGIGQFRDDPDRMIRAAEALRAANARVTLAVRA